MSKNRNRKKLDKSNNSKEYTKILNGIIYPKYWEENYTWWHGDFPNHKWREHKTWKYNRKTQWK
jgi:hypothetical protein